MQDVVDIKVIVYPKNIPTFSYIINCHPYLNKLSQIYIPPINIRTKKLAYNMSAPKPDTDYNEECSAVEHCRTECESMRKVVSHVFGRNKTCTLQIPEACTIKYCRQHYQRLRYRSNKNWIITQIDIIGRQLDRMEDWGGVKSWTINWGKGEKEAIDVENAVIAQRANDASHHENVAGFTAINYTGTANAIEKPIEENQAPTSSVRFLLPHIGTGKTFDQVRDTVRAIETWAESPNGSCKPFPQIEFLPDIDKELYPPAQGKKEHRRRKPVTPTAGGSSSSSTVASASTSSAKSSSKPHRKNPTRGVKRSHSNAFEDETSDQRTDENTTTKTNSSTKPREAKAPQPTATPKATIGRKRSRKGPASK